MPAGMVQLRQLLREEPLSALSRRSRESLVNADLMLASAYKFDSGWILG